MSRQIRIPSAVQCALVVAITAMTSLAAARSPDAAAETEYWSGTVSVPTGSLDILVAFTPTEDGAKYTAKIDIRAQGAIGLPLEDVEYTAERLAFRLGGAANAMFTAKRTGDTAEGALNQAGGMFPLKLRHISAEEAKSAGANRPQTPKPPFPYEAREVSYENADAGIKLAGTLTLPAGGGPHPAVVMITGSGAQDRDETIFEHKPFAVIADYLTRRGIAVLRVDDRGVGGSTGSPATSTTEDFVTDVLAGVKFLKSLHEIDSTRIALIGHSEGGVIAPMVAAKSSEIRAIVLLAGTGIPGRELLALQLAKIQRSAGVPADNVEAQVAAQRRAFDALFADPPTPDAFRAAVAELIEIQQKGNPGGTAMTAEQMEAAIKQQSAMLQSPWFKMFLKLDPRDALRRVKCPVLALNGTLDTQVPPDENLPEIEKSLKAAGNTDITVRRLERVNHLFQECTLGHPGEYATIEQTITPVALEAIGDWLSEKFAARGK